MFTYLLQYATGPDQIFCGAYSSVDRALDALADSDIDDDERNLYEVWEIKLDHEAVFYLEHLMGSSVEEAKVQLGGKPSVVRIVRWDDAQAEMMRDA